MLFIILSQPRSGTHMLQTALNKHPYIRCFPGLISGYAMRHKEYRELGVEDKDANTQSIIRAAEKSHNKLITGFCIHTHDIACGNFKDIPMEDTRVILLKRHNKLEQYVSHKKAITTDKWVVKSLEENEHRKFDMTYGQLKAIHENNRIYEDYCEQYLEVVKPHSICELYYEDMVHDWRNTILDLMEFFELPWNVVMPEDMMADTIKTGYSMKDTLTNYDELKNSCTNTFFEQFFCD